MRVPILDTTPKPPKFSTTQTEPVIFRNTFTRPQVNFNKPSKKRLTSDDLFRVADIVHNKISNRPSSAGTGKKPLSKLRSTSANTKSDKRKKVKIVKLLDSQNVELLTVGSKGVGRK